MTTDSETTEQYLNFVRTRFLISVPVFVSRDYEPQSCTGLIFQFANAFAIAITFARWRRRSEESTAVPYGANFFVYDINKTLHSYRVSVTLNVCSMPFKQ